MTIYATTSTVSGSGDQGGDPNQVVSVTDRLGAADPGYERFSTVAPPRFGVRYGGVAVLPATWGARSADFVSCARSAGVPACEPAPPARLLKRMRPG